MLQQSARRGKYARCKAMCQCKAMSTAMQGRLPQIIVQVELPWRNIALMMPQKQFGSGPNDDNMLQGEIPVSYAMCMAMCNTSNDLIKALESVLPMQPLTWPR